MLGLLLGLILSAGIVVVITVMNDSIKTEDDIEKYLGISTLAVVPDITFRINLKCRYCSGYYSYE